MSRSRPNANSNPAIRWFEWAGDAHDGFVRYYDKERKTNVPVPMPFRFLALDSVACVTGYNRADDTGIYSNEVRNTNEEPLIVKTSNNRLIAEGYWNDIKGEVSTSGGKFTQSVYIAFYDDDGNLQVGNFKFRGASLGEWIEFGKQHKRDIYKYGISIYGKEIDTSGKIEYSKPVMKLIEVSEEAQETAYDLDKIVQEYLDANTGKAVAHDDQPDQEYSHPEEPYSPQQPKASDAPKSPAGMAIDETFDDMDDDLPF